MTTTLKRLILALAMTLILPECPAFAGLIWDFSYTVSDGTNTSGASGTLTTTSTPTGGPYTVTGISATWTYDNTVSEPISTLVALGGFDNNDNLLSPTSPFITGNGISFEVPTTTIAGDSINQINIYCSNEYNQQLGNNGSFELDVLGSSISEFTLTPATAVPEPSTAVLAAIGAVVSTAV